MHPARLLLYALVLVGAVNYGTASAEVITDPQVILKEGSRANAWFLSKQVIATLFNVGKYWDKKLNRSAPCSDEAVRQIRISIEESVDFPESSPNPITGVWYYQFTYFRCGQAIQNNVLFASQQGRIEVIPYPPGDSRATPTLMRDASRTMFAKALLAAGGCTGDSKTEVLETSLTKEPILFGAPGSPIERWEERWTIRACGKDVMVDVCFHSEKPKGTTISTAACRS